MYLGFYIILSLKMFAAIENYIVTWLNLMDLLIYCKVMDNDGLRARAFP